MNVVWFSWISVYNLSQFDRPFLCLPHVLFKWKLTLVWFTNFIYVLFHYWTFLFFHQLFFLMRNVNKGRNKKMVIWFKMKQIDSVNNIKSENMEVSCLVFTMLTWIYIINTLLKNWYINLALKFTTCKIIFFSWF